MLYRRERNWPPSWIWAGTGVDAQPRGEVGFLHDIQIFKVDPRVVLLMALHDVAYIGCLQFDDAANYQRIGAILRRQIGRRIKDIGDLDLSALLSTAAGVAAPVRLHAVVREAPLRGEAPGRKPRLDRRGQARE